MQLPPGPPPLPVPPEQCPGDGKRPHGRERRYRQHRSAADRDRAVHHLRRHGVVVDRDRADGLEGDRRPGAGRPDAAKVRVTIGPVPASEPGLATATATRPGPASLDETRARPARLPWRGRLEPENGRVEGQDHVDSAEILCVGDRDRNDHGPVRSDGPVRDRDRQPCRRDREEGRDDEGEQEMAPRGNRAAVRTGERMAPQWQRPGEEACGLSRSGGSPPTISWPTYH